METADEPTIVNVGYRSTNYWVISATNCRILVDIGWPGTLGTMRANLARMDVPLEELCFALATHFHMDHAGLAEDLKMEGVQLVLLDFQMEAISAMKQWMKPGDEYTEITMEGNRVITLEQSRDFLAGRTLSGEILHTPGHSDDSLSLLLDDGSVFTGDLPAEELCWENQIAQESWAKLRQRGARVIYPGHGPVRPMIGT